MEMGNMPKRQQPVQSAENSRMKLRKEMGNVSKRQQPDHRADNTNGSSTQRKIPHRSRASAGP